MSGQGSLLVVDDDEYNRDLLSRRLLRRGFDVALGHDGAHALELIRAGSFDLVLLDVMMPGIDGFEVLRVLRETYSPTDLPVIMATARGDSPDIVRALELGANDYVTKPLDFPVVLARIRTQLELKRAVERARRLERSLAERNEELEQANAILTAHHNRVMRDLGAAARIQEAYLPRGVPDLPGVSVAWDYRPCEELAGDGLNVARLDERHAGLYILDVSGHGVASALLSVSLSRALAAPPDPQSILVLADGDPARPRIVPPAEVADRLNRLFPFDTATEQYATMIYAVLDAATGELRYVSAGHPGLVLLPADGEPTIWESTGFPIGLAESAYQEQSLRLGPGDRVFLYTDGLTEALDADRVAFGVDRLLAAIRAGRGAPLEEGVTALIEQVHRWCNGERIRDDISLLAVEFDPAAGGPRGPAATALTRAP